MDSVSPYLYVSHNISFAYMPNACTQKIGNIVPRYLHTHNVA